MAELARACPGTTPGQWWDEDPADVLTMLDVLTAD